MCEALKHTVGLAAAAVYTSTLVLTGTAGSATIQLYKFEYFSEIFCFSLLEIFVNVFA